MSYTKQSDLIVYETTDYGQFALLQENRPVCQNMRLEEAILEHNKLKYNPIIVNPDFEILDGQHRLAIAIKHKLPIFYVVDVDSNDATIQKLNIGNRNWTQDDHLHYFASMGYPDYVDMQDLVKRFPIAVSTFVYVFCGELSKGKHKSEFKVGKAKLKYPKEYIEDVLTKFEEINHKIKFIISSKSCKHLNRGFVSVLCRLIMHEQYNHQSMMQNIDRYADGILKANSFINMENIAKSLLDDVYNKKKQYENRISLF